jgi:tetratricopeptide (TPR) repeat protein
MHPARVDGARPARHAVAMSRIDRIRQMLEKSPEDADLRYMLAQELAKGGDHAGAVVQYDACIESSPDYLYAYFHKASSLQSAGDLPGAKAALETGLQRATAAGDPKAISELSAFLEGLAD